MRALVCKQFKISVTGGRQITFQAPSFMETWVRKNDWLIYFRKYGACEMTVRTWQNSTHTFLTTEPDEGGWSDSRSGCTTPGGRTTSTQRIASWLGPKTVVLKTTLLIHARNRHRSRSLPVIEPSRMQFFGIFSQSLFTRNIHYTIQYTLDSRYTFIALYVYTECPKSLEPMVKTFGRELPRLALLLIPICWKEFKETWYTGSESAWGLGVDKWNTYCTSNKAYVMYLLLVPDFSDTCICVCVCVYIYIYSTYIWKGNFRFVAWSLVCGAGWHSILKRVSSGVLKPGRRGNRIVRQRRPWKQLQSTVMMAVFWDGGSKRLWNVVKYLHIETSARMITIVSPLGPESMCTWLTTPFFPWRG
jgi:hypothetical protein